MRPGREPEVQAEALANLVTRIYRIQAGELPGRTLVTERAAAVGLAGLAVKPGSVAEACGVPNIPRIGHNTSDDRVHSRTGAYARR